MTRGDAWYKGGQDDLLVPHPGRVGVKDGAVAVHQDHGGGEVEQVGREDQGHVGVEISLAHHQPVDVEVEPTGHNQAVQADRRSPGHEDVRHAFL